jgi:hypothetical protein
MYLALQRQNTCFTIIMDPCFVIFDKKNTASLRTYKSIPLWILINNHSLDGYIGSLTVTWHALFVFFEHTSHFIHLFIISTNTLRYENSTYTGMWGVLLHSPVQVFDNLTFNHPQPIIGIQTELMTPTKVNN